MDPNLVQKLVRDIERKDLTTAAHTWRVVLYSRALAEALGISDHRLELVTHAAALHDIGKLDTPDAILDKPGPLTVEERAIMERHTIDGDRRLRELGVSDPLILELVRHHHERMDGSGYPDRLRGDAISMGAKFFSVIDTFDAMTSLRPYRRDVGPEAADRALRALREETGTRYCPDAVRQFVHLYEGGWLSWILDHYNDRASLDAYDASVAKSLRR
jgi:putative nucleotidyltransferase with HDIG domain